MFIVFICFYWFSPVFLDGESKSRHHSPHRLQVYLLPLEGVRGVDPSLWEGLGRLYMQLSTPRVVAMAVRIAAKV